MTLIRRLRLNLLTMGWALRASFPNTAMAFVPALITFVAFALAVPLTKTVDGAFVVAFITGYGAHAWLRLPGLAKGDAVAMFGSETAVIIPVVIMAIMVVIGQPVGCLRVFSVFAAVRALMLADDLWRRRFTYVQSIWPDARYRASDAMMAQAFLVWNLGQILLIEIVIFSGNLVFWLAFAAFAHILTGTVNRMLETSVLLQRKDLQTQ
jgi:hypothetical protein